MGNDVSRVVGQNSIPPKQEEISAGFQSAQNTKRALHNFTVLFQPHSVEIYIKHRKTRF
jgi:hypothetical protein